MRIRAKQWKQRRRRRRRAENECEKTPHFETLNRRTSWDNLKLLRWHELIRSHWIWLRFSSFFFHTFPFFLHSFSSAEEKKSLVRLHSHRRLWPSAAMPNDWRVHRMDGLYRRVQVLLIKLLKPFSNSNRFLSIQPLNPSPISTLASCVASDSILPFSYFFRVLFQNAIEFYIQRIAGAYIPFNVFEDNFNRRHRKHTYSPELCAFNESDEHKLRVAARISEPKLNSTK